jgi:hypothetical protein
MAIAPRFAPCVLVSGFLSVLVPTSVAQARQVAFVNAALTTGLNDGSSWANAYRGPLGVKAAVDAASAAGANEIWVAKGVYYAAPVGSPASATLLLRAGVSLLGGFAGNETRASQADPSQHVTILSGDLPGGPAGQPELEAIVTIGNAGSTGDPEIRLQGCTLDACLVGTPANAPAAPRRGLVILGGAPVIANCIIRDGRAPKGAGVLAIDSTADITGCTIVENIATQAGGGLFADRTSDVRITHTLIANNRGGLGAGVYFGAFGNETAGGGFPVCADTDFVDNRGIIGAASGGGVYAQRVQLDLQRCRFLHCVVPGGGGGVFAQDSVLSLDRCAFIGCSAAGDGGGAVYLNNSGSPSLQRADLWNCLLSGNHNALLARNGSEADLHNCTIANGRPQPGQPLVFPALLANGPAPSAIVISNSILWGNAPLPGAPVGGNVLALAGSSVSFERCLVQGWSGPIGGISGSQMLSADPMFADGDGADDLLGSEDDDLRPSFASPCIDAGASERVGGAFTLDFRGFDRFTDLAGVVDTGSGEPTYLDIGCYERSTLDCPTDLSGDGCTDGADLGLLLGAWGARNGLGDIDGDGVVGAADLAVLLGAFGEPCS